MGLSELLFGGSKEVYSPETKRRHEYGDFLGKQQLGRVGSYYLPQMMEQIGRGKEDALTSLSQQEAYFSSLMGDEMEKGRQSSIADLASRGISTGARSGIQQQMLKMMSDKAQGFSAQLGGARANIHQASAQAEVGALQSGMAGEAQATGQLMNWQTMLMPMMQSTGGILGPLAGMAGMALGSGDFFSSFFGGGDEGGIPNPIKFGQGSDTYNSGSLLMDSLGG